MRKAAVSAPVLLRRRFGHEDHVDVARVVQLARAALAHGDHRDAARRCAWRQMRAGDGESALERRGRQLGQLGHHVIDRQCAGDVACGDPQQSAPVGQPELARIRGAAHLGVEAGRLFVNAVPAAAEQLPVAGMPAQMIGQRGTGPEDGSEAGSQGGVRAQCCAQPLVWGDSGQACQREVRVGSGPERTDNPSVIAQYVPAQLVGEQTLGGRRISEAQRGKPASLGHCARHAHG